MPQEDLRYFEWLVLSSATVTGDVSATVSRFSDAVAQFFLVPPPRVIVARGGGTSFTIISDTNLTVNGVAGTVNDTVVRVEVMRFLADKEQPILLNDRSFVAAGGGGHTAAHTKLTWQPVLEKNRETLPAFTCCIVNGHMVYHGIASHPMYYFGGFGATDGTEAT
jgi:hypothetical protein